MALTSFASLMNNRIFEIPPNQRGFSWGKTQFEALKRDLLLVAGLGRGENHHYSGTIVYKLTDELRETNNHQTLQVASLEDGQQRLTTLHLIAKHLSDRLCLYNPQDPEFQAGMALKASIVFQPRGGGPTERKLTNSNARFDAMLEHVILGGVAPALDSSPLENLHNMNQRVLAWVGGLVHNELLEWKNRIENVVMFSEVDLATNSVNKFLAFDAINSRGLDLSDFDKVKNFCCLVYSLRGIAGTQPDTHWIQALQELSKGSCDSRSEENTFISDLFGVHHGTECKPEKATELMLKTYESLLFGPNPLLQGHLTAFVEEWPSYAKSFAFVTTKKRHAFHPARPSRPANPDTRCTAAGAAMMAKIDRLNYKNTTRKILTACHRKMSHADFASSADLLEKFSFRIFGVMSRRIDAHGKILQKAASHIYIGVASPADYLKRVVCFSLHRPSGASMRAVIQQLCDGGPKYTWATDGWDRCYYFLHEFNDDSTFAWASTDESQKGSMEHILPQGRRNPSWTAAWPNEDEQKKFVHRLGNLVLTKDTSSNSTLHDKYIDLKISDNTAAYDYTRGTRSERDIHRFAGVAGAYAWTQQEILKRELDMIRWAANRWKIDCCNDHGNIPLPEEFHEFEEGAHIALGQQGRVGCIEGIDEPDWPVIEALQHQNNEDANGDEEE